MAFKEAIEKYVGPLLTSQVMTGDLGQYDTETLVKAWAMLRYTQERIDDRMKALRKLLLARAETYGKRTDRGGNRLFVEGSEVMRERRQSALPDEKTVRRLLEEYGLGVDKAFSSVTKVVLDASKLKALVDLGKLPEDEIEEARKVVWALRVKEAPELIEDLDALAGVQQKELFEEPREKRTEAVGPRKRRGK